VVQAAQCRQVTWIVALLLLAAGVARAPIDRHDARALTRAEEATFLSLACRRHTPAGGKVHCIGRIRSPKPPLYADEIVQLTSLAYGSFTRSGAREAYVSYASSAEPHVFNFGGGILFERRGNRWAVVRWYPGGQIDGCLALPGGGRTPMLCQSYYGNAGRLSSQITVRRVPPDPHVDKDVLVARDDRGLVMNRNEIACDMSRFATGDALLMNVDGLRRSNNPAYFAEADVAYATRADVDDGCGRKQFETVRKTKGIVRFLVHGTTVTVATPVHFGGT
jgi:hypothetical protein